MGISRADYYGRYLAVDFSLSGSYDMDDYFTHIWFTKTTPDGSAAGIVRLPVSNSFFDGRKIILYNAMTGTGEISIRNSNDVPLTGGGGSLSSGRAARVFQGDGIWQYRTFVASEGP